MLLKEKYLKPPQHYIDRYDLQTIKTCICWIQDLQKKLPEMTKEGRKNDWLRAINIVVHSIKLERFKNKKETLDNWIARDRKKQDLYDTASPAKIYCPKCNILMNDYLKTIRDFTNKPLRVLFFYECPRCNYRDGQFDDGQKYESKPDICEKCGNEIRVSIEADEKEDKTTWIYKCTGCDYKRVEVDNHKKWKLDQEQRKRSDKELLVQYKSKFCFTKEEGNEAILHMGQVANLVGIWKEQEKKKAEPAYQKAKQLKKLTVVQLQKLLDKKLTTEKFINLQFDKPEMGRCVIIPFTVQEADSDREEYDGKNQLKKLIKSSLVGTNWRLMSDGISYRVGYLSGRFRCYENGEEIAEFLKGSK